MRTIKFRGLRFDGKGWVCGHYYDDEIQSFIISGINTYEVIPESIGQFTGLIDVDGKEIYEGDTVYLSGKGNENMKFPFYDLYDALFEKDIGKIIGNIHEK